MNKRWTIVCASVCATGAFVLATQTQSQQPEPEGAAGNVIANPAENTVEEGVVGATIAGGGSLSAPQQVLRNFGTVGGGTGNSVEGSYGTIAGGVGNRVRGSRAVVGGGRANFADGAAATVGGGFTNSATGDYGTIAGGWRNESSGYVSTIGGGWENIATGQVSVVGGGQYNTSLGAAATVSGGWRNRAEGAGSSIPGGRDNVASGEYSLAGGRNATAGHAGSFVWSDSSETGFASSGPNQFLIEAAGNVGIDVSTPMEKLTVRGNIAPAPDVDATLGTDGARWQSLFLRDRISYTGSLSMEQGGRLNLAIDPLGNLTVTGVVRAARFEGDGSGLTDLPSTLSEGSVQRKHIAPAAVSLTQLDLEQLDERYLEASREPAASDVAAPASGAKTPSLEVVPETEYRLVVNGVPAIRIDGSVETPNYTLGHSSNSVTEAVMGAVVAGGGRRGNPNIVEANFGTVSGGMGNTVRGPYSSIGGGFNNSVLNSGSTIGGGIGNTADNWNATVSGGRDNAAAGLGATIGGGRGNIASNRYATISGGYFNAATGAGATIGGGFANAAEGFIATVPGGSQNEASGEYSMAAGRRAKATHDGVFVWADATEEDFASTQPNQVIFRAGGGLGIGTANTPEKLTVAGNVAPSSAGSFNLGTADRPWGTVHVQEEIRYPETLLFSQAGTPVMELKEGGEVLIHGTLRASSFEGSALAAGSAAASSWAGSINSEAIEDGSIQPKDLNLPAFGEWIGEKVDELTSKPFDDVESDLEELRTYRIGPDTMFDGAVTGTYQNLGLRRDIVGSDQIADGSVGLDDVDLEAFERRMTTLVDGRLESFQPAAAPTQPMAAGPTAPGDETVFDAHIAADARIAPEKIAGVALTAGSQFDGDVVGISTNLQIRAGAVGSEEIAAGSIGIDRLNPDEFGALVGETVVSLTREIQTRTQQELQRLEQTALPRDVDFDGDVRGGYSNLLLRAGAVGSDEIADGSVGLDDVDLEAFERRMTTLVDGRLESFQPAAAPTQPMAAGPTAPGDETVFDAHIAADARVAPEKIAGVALTAESRFDGDVAGISTNLQLQAGAVGSREIAAGSVGIDRLNPEEFGALVGETVASLTGEIQTRTQQELQRLEQTALPRDVGFDGDVRGAYSNLLLRAGAVGSDEIADGSIELEDVNLDALDQRIETLVEGRLESFQPAAAPTQPSAAGPTVLGDETVFDPHIAADARIAPEKIAGVALTAESRFDGDVAGTATNLQLQAESVGSREIAAGSIGIDRLNPDEFGALVGETVNSLTQDLRTRHQQELQRLEQAALPRDIRFDGDVTGTATLLQLRAGSVGSREIAAGSIGVDRLDAAQLGALVGETVYGLTADEQERTEQDVLRLEQNALRRDLLFSGDVQGVYSNLTLRAGVVGSEEIADGSIRLDDVDLNELQERIGAWIDDKLVGLPALDAKSPPPSPVLEPGIISNLHVAVEAAISPEKIAGGALTGASVFGGDVTGTANRLRLRPGSVGAREIAPGSIGMDRLDAPGLGTLIGETVQAITSDTHSRVAQDLRRLDRSALRRADPFQGDVQGVYSNLRLRVGAVSSEAIADGSVQLRDLDQEQLAAGFLPREGGRMTGGVQLPPDGLTIGVGQFTLRNGDLGLGTTSPKAKLDVEGRIRIAGGEPGEGKVLVSDADGVARWSMLDGLAGSARTEANLERVREGSLFGPRMEQPLVLQVAGRQALRIEPEAGAPNLIGGSDQNTAMHRTSGVTISGGGATDQPQRVEADFGSIGGGAGNRVEGSFGRVGGGWFNTAQGARAVVGGGRLNQAGGVASVVGGGFTNRATGGYALVGGGYANEASGYVATISGGWGNTATGIVSAVGGGQDNAAWASGATVGGGWQNRASGIGAVVPGGKSNVAAGDFSVAMGLGSTANHSGTFVWSDSEETEFASSGPDQFLIQARGNVGIDTPSPSEKLTVSGNVAPAVSRRHDLGSPALRWETAYLGSTIDVGDSLRLVLDGQTRLAITRDGDTDLAGSLTASAFVGDGARLTGLPPTPPKVDSILNQHIRLNADIDPAKIRGEALTRQSRFSGDLAGGYDSLTVQPRTIRAEHLDPDLLELMRRPINAAPVLPPGAVRREHLDPDLLSSLRPPTVDWSNLPSLQSTGTVVAGSFAGDGSQLTNLPNPLPPPGSLYDVHLSPSADIDPNKIRGGALTGSSRFTGDVAGSVSTLILQPGVVRTEHIAPDLLASLQSPSIASPNLQPGAVLLEHLSPEIVEAMKPPEVEWNNITNLTASGTIRARRLAGDGSALTGLPPTRPAIDSILNQHIQAKAEIDPSKIRGEALTGETRFGGDITGTYQQLSLQKGTVHEEHVDPDLLASLRSPAVDWNALPGIRSIGPIAAESFIGDGSRLTNLPNPLPPLGSLRDLHLAREADIHPAKIRGGALTERSRFGGDVAGSYQGLTLQPGAVRPEHLSPEVAAAMAPQETDWDLLPDLTSTGAVRAARFAGNGSELTDLPPSPPMVDSILNQHIRTGANIDPAKIRGNALTGESRFRGDVGGPFDQLTLQPGAVRTEHLAPEVLESMQPPSIDWNALPNLRSSGVVSARGFAGDGSQLTNLPQPPPRPASIRNDHLADDAAIAPSKIDGVALTRATLHGGMVTGTYDQLRLRPGAVTADHLAPDVITALRPEPIDWAAIPSLTVTGTVTARQFVGDGAQLTNLPTPPPLDESIRNQHIAPDAMIDPSKIKGGAITAETVFEGDVAGGYRQLRLRPAAIEPEHLAKATIDALRPRSGSISSAELASGAVQPRHLSEAAMDAIRALAPDFRVVPELTVRQTLRAGRLEGDGSGLRNLRFASIDVPADSITRTMLAPNSVHVEHLSPGLAEALRREVPDLTKLKDLNLAGTLRADRIVGDGSGLRALRFEAISIPDGSITGTMIRHGAIRPEHLAEAMPSPRIDEARVWLLGGNDTGRSDAAVIGTKNTAPVHLWVQGQPGFRLTAAGNSINLVAGHPENRIEAAVSGGVISGGGERSGPNRVTQNFAAIGGGARNRADGEYSAIGGGAGNRTTALDATIAGGQDNLATGSGSTIGGGFTNQTSGSFAFVGGGAANQAIGHVAAIGGGYGNIARGAHAVVPGGSQNQAIGAYSLAAGRRAQAVHDGSLVWADSTDADLASTGPNQFLVRASGGVQFFTDPASRAGVRLDPGSGSWASASDATIKRDHQPVDPEAVLENVLDLPLSTWSYVTESSSSRHLGPTARAFHHAFGLGPDETHIASLDADGVALAAIQGLHRRLKERDDRIRKLESENSSLVKRIAAIEARLTHAPDHRPELPVRP